MGNKAQVKSGMPFVWVEQDIVTDTSLSAYDKSVYFALCSYADNDNSEAWPSIGMLSQRAGCSESATRRSLRNLIKRNYVQRKARSLTNGSSDTNLYIVRLFKRYPPDHTDPSCHTDRTPPVTQTGAPCHTDRYPPVTQTPELDSEELDSEELEFVCSSEHTLTQTSQRLPSLSEEHPRKKDIRVWKKKANGRGTINYPEPFETWWKEYPRKLQKKASFRAWLLSLEAGAGTGELLDAAKAYAARTHGTEEQFIKHPTTFLGPSEPWRDYAGIEEAEQEQVAQNAPFWARQKICPICFDTPEEKGHQPGCPHFRYHKPGVEQIVPDDALSPLDLGLYNEINSRKEIMKSTYKTIHEMNQKYNREELTDWYYEMMRINYSSIVKVASS